MPPESLTDSRLALHRTPLKSYTNDGVIDTALSALCSTLGWSTSAEGPFGRLVEPGANVLVKPNWVLHGNQGTGGFEELVTHGTVVRAVIRALGESNAGRFTLGDAPMQGCDFQQLLQNSAINSWARELSLREPRFLGPVDFRRTISAVESGVRQPHENARSMEHYVLFDVGDESYLEPVTGDKKDFRVTMYPPHLMAATHSPGRHQYLVAREVLEADLIVNLPKLKTHKKAGVTCALKNLVGINGNKEYLPHHRLGGSADGGDCYPGSSPVKRILEKVLDAQNSVSGSAAQRALGVVARGLNSVSHRMGDELGVEGSWSGNDTVWRMCLDLNRIALYGRQDGTIADTPQRRIVQIVDAVVAGQGDGPLAPDPLPIGMMIAGASACAMDWFGASLLGYNPARIPIAARSFDASRWPLARFAPDEIRVLEDGSSSLQLVSQFTVAREISYPAGWRDAVQRFES